MDFTLACVLSILDPPKYKVYWFNVNCHYRFNGSFTLSCSYEAVLTQGKEKHKFEGQHSSILATLFFTSIGGF
ncbi:hypothetical protein C4D60_Mb09t17250 [Musa balbisiana]|uniref:Uncharacterized protein n=1 Tax=Musa balbisiana TaxID=52838 RepID=A0A4V6T417_MUSBA|nr:hypothetical protein C4D60_Mb09t17250 [Musa balbisiana]